MVCVFVVAGVCGQQQQCYVCVPNSNYDGDVIKMFPGETLPLCGATLVAKVCPATYSRGCLTEINGTVHVTVTVITFTSMPLVWPSNITIT